MHWRRLLDCDAPHGPGSKEDRPEEQPKSREETSVRTGELCQDRAIGMGDRGHPSDPFN